MFARTIVALLLAAAACGGSEPAPRGPGPTTTLNFDAAAAATSAADAGTEAASGAETATGADPDAATGMTAALGATHSTPSLSASSIKSNVKAARHKFQRCYKDALRTQPLLAGAVKLQFTIGPAGTVTSATARGLGVTVDPCIERVMRGLVFAPPAGGASVQVRYPFMFRP